MIVSCMLVFLTEFTGFIKESEGERERAREDRNKQEQQEQQKHSVNKSTGMKNAWKEGRMDGWKEGRFKTDTV